MAPETHTRYRVQRLIRLGEWLEQNEDALIMALQAIDMAHDTIIDPDEALTPAEVLEMVGSQMWYPLKVLNRLRTDLCHGIPTRDVKRGKDVTIYQRYASTENRYEVVMPAPVPKLEQDS